MATPIDAPTQSHPITTGTGAGLDVNKPLPPPDAGTAHRGVPGVAPPSQVADTVYPNVPETTAGQQAATAPGDGTELSHSEGNSPTKPKFKDQVNGFAKKFAGKVFNNEKEVQHGKELHGEVPQGTAAQTTTASGPAPGTAPAPSST